MREFSFPHFLIIYQIPFFSVAYDDNGAVLVGAVYRDSLCGQSVDHLRVRMSVGVTLSAGDYRDIGIKRIKEGLCGRAV